MSYVTILTEQVNFTDEQGQVHSLQAEILEFDGSSSSDPIGLVGDLIYKVGSKSNSIDKVINPTQIQFKVRDDSNLLSKLRGGKERDFKLILNEDGQEIFHGYLLLKSKKRVFYQDIPQIEMRAFDGLSLLDSTPIELSDTYDKETPITIKEFLTRAEQAIGVELGWLFYSNYNDPATDRHFPLDYEFKIGHLLRNISESERTWGEALRLFARDHFGMQVYQWNGKWNIIGRTERVLSASSITKINLSTEQVSTVDLTGPSIDQSNSIRFPDGEVVEKISAVRTVTDLNDHYLRNPDINFEGSEIPFWVISQVSQGTSDEGTESVAVFDTLGTSYIQQVGKTVLESKEVYTGGHDPSEYEYVTRFDVEIEIEVYTDQSQYQGTESWSELDMFRLDFVDPNASDLYSSVPLSEQVNVIDIDSRTNETLYGGTSGRPAEDKWFDVRLQANENGFAKDVYSVTRSFKIYLPNLEGAPDQNNTEVITRRYVRPIVKPRIKPDQHGGDGSKITGVQIKRFEINRVDDNAPNYTSRNTLFSVGGTGEVIEQMPTLSASSEINGIFTMQAPVSGSLEPVDQLQIDGRDYPDASGYNRIAMQARALELVNLQTRNILGTSPLQSLSFDTGDGGNISILPIMWKRQLKAGYITISAAEGRHDSQDISESVTFGPASSTTASQPGGGTGNPGNGANSDHGTLLGLNDPEDHPWAMKTDFSNAQSWQLPNVDPVFNTLKTKGNIVAYEDGGGSSIPDNNYQVDELTVSDNIYIPDPNDLNVNDGLFDSTGKIKDKFIGVTGGGGAVDSVFGRTGVVSAQSGDYSVSQISGLNSALGSKANTAGTYANLRAQATTAADVGLGSVRNVASYSQSEANSRYAKTAGDTFTGILNVGAGFRIDPSTNWIWHKSSVGILNFVADSQERGFISVSRNNFGSTSSANRIWDLRVKSNDNLIINSISNGNLEIGETLIDGSLDFQDPTGSKGNNIKNVNVLNVRDISSNRGSSPIEIISSINISGISRASDHKDNSDRRIKSNIVPISGRAGLRFVRGTNSYTFTKHGKIKSAGYLADEVEKVTRNVVSKSNMHGYSDFRSMSAMGVAGYNSAAIRALDQKINQLQQQIRQLRGKA